MQGTMKKTADIHTYSYLGYVQNGALLIPYTTIPKAGKAFVTVDYAYGNSRWLDTNVVIAMYQDQWCFYIRRAGVTPTDGEPIMLYIMTVD